MEDRRPAVCGRTRTHVRIFSARKASTGTAKLPPCATDGCRSRSSRPSSSATTRSPTTCRRAPSPTGASPTSGSTSTPARAGNGLRTRRPAALLRRPPRRSAAARGGGRRRRRAAGGRRRRHAGRGRGAVRHRDVAARAGRPRGRRPHELRDEPRDATRDRRRRSTSSTSPSTTAGASTSTASARACHRASTRLISVTCPHNPTGTMLDLRVVARARRARRAVRRGAARRRDVP